MPLHHGRHHKGEIMETNYTNLEIRQLNDSIVSTLNQSNLPVEVKRLVVDKILSVLTEAANEMVKREIDETMNISEKKESEHE